MHARAGRARSSAHAALSSTHLLLRASPAPARAEPEELEQPVWVGPPQNVLGAAVPIRILLARTDNVAVAITDATAYPTGFALTLALRRRTLEDPHGFNDPFMFRSRRPSSELPPEVLRFGIQFSDGAKATNLAPWMSSGDETPAGPVLVQRGGGGGGHSWDMSFWVWPLPPPGPLAFVSEWPAESVPLTRKEIDAGLILEAAERAEFLWEDPGGSSSGGGWTSYGAIASTTRRSS